MEAGRGRFRKGRRWEGEKVQVIKNLDAFYSNGFK